MSKVNLEYYLGLEYEIIVQLVEVDGETWYTAFAKELGKLSCYGKGQNASEAIASFINEKNDFISYLFENDMEIPEPKSTNQITERYNGFFNIRTSPFVHAMLAEQASKMGISLNLYINQILIAEIDLKEFEHSID